MKTLFRSLFSFFWVVVLLVLVTAPGLVGELLVANPFSDFQGEVAGTQTEKLISVYPNFLDFNGYVSFNLGTSGQGEFIDELELTSFKAQIANFQNLYEIYNNTSKSLKLSVVTTRQDFEPAFQSLTLTLKGPQQEGVTTLKEDAAPGATFLEVEDSQVFSEESDFIIVEETPIKKIAADERGLVIMPFYKSLPKLTLVYSQSILIKNGQVLLPATQEVTLPPKQKASVDVIIKGKLEDLTPTRRLTLPLVFKVSPTQ